MQTERPETIKFPQKYRVSVRQYEQMVRERIITEQDRVELIQGQLLVKPQPSIAAEECLWRLRNAMEDQSIIHENCVLRASSPITTSDSAFHVDLLLASLVEEWYGAGELAGDSIYLAVQISDVLLESDRSRKVPLFASAGIPEAWVVNLVDNQIEVFRGVSPSSGYRDKCIVKRGEEVRLSAFPDHPLDADSILGS